MYAFFLSQRVLILSLHIWCDAKPPNVWCHIQCYDLENIIPVLTNSGKFHGKSECLFVYKVHQLNFIYQFAWVCEKQFQARLLSTCINIYSVWRLITSNILICCMHWNDETTRKFSVKNFSSHQRKRKIHRLWKSTKLSGEARRKKWVQGLLWLRWTQFDVVRGGNKQQFQLNWKQTPAQLPNIHQIFHLVNNMQRTTLKCTQRAWVATRLSELRPALWSHRKFI